MVFFCFSGRRFRSDETCRVQFGTEARAERRICAAHQRKLLRRLITQPFSSPPGARRVMSPGKLHTPDGARRQRVWAFFSHRIPRGSDPARSPLFLFFMPPTNDRGGRECSGFRVASSSRRKAPPLLPISSRRCVESVHKEEFRGARRTVSPSQGCVSQPNLRSMWASCLLCSATASSSLPYCRWVLMRIKRACPRLHSEKETSRDPSGASLELEVTLRFLTRFQTQTRACSDLSPESGTTLLFSFLFSFVWLDNFLQKCRLVCVCVYES